MNVRLVMNKIVVGSLFFLVQVSSNLFAEACIIELSYKSILDKSCLQNKGMKSKNFQQFCKAQAGQTNVKVKKLKKCPTAAYAYCEQTLPARAGKIRTYTYSKNSISALKRSCNSNSAGFGKGKWTLLVK